MLMQWLAVHKKRKRERRRLMIIIRATGKPSRSSAVNSETELNCSPFLPRQSRQTIGYRRSLALQVPSVSLFLLYREISGVKFSFESVTVNVGYRNLIKQA